MTLQEYFNNIEYTKENDCWIWNKRVDRLGNPIDMIQGIDKAYVAAFSWKYYKKQIPEEGLVHKQTCGNKRCINPDHIMWVDENEYIQQKKDEEKDYINRIRTKAKTKPIKDIAKEEGISYSTIYNIIKGYSHTKDYTVIEPVKKKYKITEDD